MNMPMLSYQDRKLMKLKKGNVQFYIWSTIATSLFTKVLNSVQPKIRNTLQCVLDVRILTITVFFIRRMVTYHFSEIHESDDLRLVQKSTRPSSPFHDCPIRKEDFSANKDSKRRGQSDTVKPLAKGRSNSIIAQK